jgi:hypothetical protein
VKKKMNRRIVILFACGLLVFAAPLDTGNGSCSKDAECNQNETCKIEPGNMTGICVGKEIPKPVAGPSASAVILYAIIGFLIVGIIAMYAAYAVKQHKLSTGEDDQSSSRLQEAAAGTSNGSPPASQPHYDVPKNQPQESEGEVVYSEIALHHEPVTDDVGNGK